MSATTSVSQSPSLSLHMLLSSSSSRLQSIISLISLLRLIRGKAQVFFPFFKMSQPATARDHQSSGPTPPPFDPTQPAVPISYPIKTLEELESRSYFESFHYPFNKSTVPLQSGSPSLSLPDRPRVIVCHDMAGGYGDDKWIQGGTNPNAYAIWHWYLIDIFIYFSHSLVTLPPPCWTNTAHMHGVKVLGTFITEGDEGKLICNKLLSTKESAEMYAKFLAELAVALGFDGWLGGTTSRARLHHNTILSALGPGHTFTVLFLRTQTRTSQWVTHYGNALARYSFNFRVPMEPEASELPKGLVLGRDGNIHIRITPLGDVGSYNPPPLRGPTSSSAHHG